MTSLVFSGKTVNLLFRDMKDRAENVRTKIDELSDAVEEFSKSDPEGADYVLTVDVSRKEK